MIALTSFSQRRKIRDELNRRIRVYVENCTCAAPQPDADDLKLDQHQPFCRFVYVMEGEKNERCHA